MATGTVPCLNPKSHRVQTHVAGSIAARMCYALSKSKSALGSVRTALYGEPSSVVSEPLNEDRIGWKLRQMLVDEDNWHRNTFHPDLIPLIPELSQRLWERAGSSNELSSLGYGVTVPRLAGHMKEKMEQAREVADSKVFTHEWSTDGSGNLIVRHQASRLRAEFIPGDDGIGYILAKPYGSLYGVYSDDMMQADAEASEKWGGLGIGTRVYLEGARLMPDYRWKDETTRDESVGVRHKLHLADPYTWHDKHCQICIETGRYWKLLKPGATH